MDATNAPKDDWTGRLSEYLDDELTPEDRRDLDRHLGECGACAATLEELRRVVGHAASLPARPPQTDLWSGIVDRMGTAAAGSPEHLRNVDARIVPVRAREQRRISFTLPQLAAASLLLALLSGGVAWRLHTPLAAPPAAPLVRVTPAAADTADAGVDPVRVEAATVGLADAQYDSAFADLQRMLRSGPGHLDPATIAIVEHNLRIIDRALDQARQAVMADPGNTYLTSHLVETRRKKLDLLRRAAALASESD